MINKQEKQRLRSKNIHKARFKKRRKYSLATPRVFRSFVAVLCAVTQFLRVAKQLYDLFR